MRLHILKATITLILLVNAGAQAAQSKHKNLENEVRQAAKLIEKVIRAKDIEAFQALHHDQAIQIECYGSDSISMPKDANYLKNIFEEGNGRPSIYEFFSKTQPSIDVITYKRDFIDTIAEIIFYNPENYNPKESGQYSDEKHNQLWHRGYVKTRVYFKNGKWGLGGYSFYSNNPEPWVTEYG